MFKRALRPRVLIYGGLLSAASVAFAASVALRSPFQVDVVKDRGALARVVEDGAIENVYRLQIMNRTEQPQTYRIDAQGIPGLEVRDAEVSAPPAGIRSVVVSLRLPYSAAQPLLGQIGARAVRSDACRSGREVDFLRPTLSGPPPAQAVKTPAALRTWGTTPSLRAARAAPGRRTAC
jgi:hypothetical protein